MQNLGKEYRDDKAGIFLRLMTPQDTDLIIAWRNSDQVRKNFIYQEPFTRAGHENWIRTMIDTGKALQFVICDTKEGKPLGSVYIRDIDRKHNKAEVRDFYRRGRCQGPGGRHGSSKADACLLL